MAAKKISGRFFTVVGGVLVLLPGGCDVVAVSNNLSHPFAYIAATHQPFVKAVAYLASVVAAYSFLSWPLLGLGATLFVIGRRRRRSLGPIALAQPENPALLSREKLDRLLRILAWFFTAGTVGMGGWIVWFLLMLGIFPSLYTPYGPPRWGYVTHFGASKSEVQRSEDALKQAEKRCVMKVAPQDAGGSGDAITFRFSGWFIDTKKSDQITACMAQEGYQSIYAGPAL